MCHEISRSSSLIYYCMDYERELFVGGKTILISKKPGELITPFMGDVVYPKDVNNYVTRQYEVVPATTCKPVVRQEVTLYIPTTTGTFGRTIRSRAGMHISPIIRVDETEYVYKYEFFPAGKYNDYPYILVVFGTSDLVFYDGVDVSVKRFYIPGGDTLKGIADELRKLFGRMEKLDMEIFKQTIKDTKKAYKAMEKAIERGYKSSAQ